MGVTYLLREADDHREIKGADCGHLPARMALGFEMTRPFEKYAPAILKFRDSP